MLVKAGPRVTMPKASQPRRPTKPSNRLTHGLASRSAAEARVAELNELAVLLIGNAPRTDEIWSAALSLADAILHFQAIQRAKFSVLSSACPASAKLDSSSPAQLNLGRPVLPEDQETKQSDGLLALRDLISTKCREFARFDEYERKALSLRRKLLIRLDYTMHETLRHK